MNHILHNASPICRELYEKLEEAEAQAKIGQKRRTHAEVIKSLKARLCKKSVIHGILHGKRRYEFLL